MNAGVDKNDIEDVIYLLYIQRHMLLKENIIYRAPFVSFYRTIGSFSDVNVPNFFAFDPAINYSNSMTVCKFLR